MTEPLDLDAIRRSLRGGDYGLWNDPRDTIERLVAEVERLRALETMFIEQMQSDQVRKDQP